MCGIEFDTAVHALVTQAAKVHALVLYLQFMHWSEYESGSHSAFWPSGSPASPRACCCCTLLSIAHEHATHQRDFERPERGGSAQMRSCSHRSGCCCNTALHLASTTTVHSSTWHQQQQCIQAAARNQRGAGQVSLNPTTATASSSSGPVSAVSLQKAPPPHPQTCQTTHTYLHTTE